MTLPNEPIGLGDGHAGRYAINTCTVKAMRMASPHTSAAMISFRVFIVQRVSGSWDLMLRASDQRRRRRSHPRTWLSRAPATAATTITTHRGPVMSRNNHLKATS